MLVPFHPGGGSQEGGARGGVKGGAEIGREGEGERRVGRGEEGAPPPPSLQPPHTTSPTPWPFPPTRGWGRGRRSSGVSPRPPRRPFRPLQHRGGREGG